MTQAQEIRFSSDTKSRKEKYQKNFPSCPECGCPMTKGSKTCAACAGKGRGALLRKKLVIRKCEFCNGIFRIPLWREKQNRGRFCSRKCKDKYLTTQKGSNSIRWRGGTAGHRRGMGFTLARKWALAFSNYKCELCGSEKQLDAHHIKPYKKCKNDTEANSPSNIMILCRSCHAKTDGLGKIERR